MPKFTQKHFKVIADILKRTYMDCDPSYIDQWNYIRDELITEFSKDNPKFNRERFLKACTTVRTED